MEQQVKNVWEQPTLETLQVSRTLEGKGSKYIDSVSPSDLDITDTPPVS
ncbi:paeninodin family lasso peptide [Paenibacillus sepulcri]|uniref:Paeninodin family lasso peptide n=1 Tax=Paenibacillus sepulcri TaxID=359917 RepID=A0ABS7BV61_9BACL|nr:paeninodin family lasso peptide [Paenibacillus sepulcri]